MRVLLHAWGSRGDVEPMLALGLALQTRGIEVGVAAAADFADAVAGAGLHYEPIEVDLASVSNSEVGKAWLGGASRGPISDLRLMRRFLEAVAEPLSEMIARTKGQYDHVVTTPVLMEAMLLESPTALSCLMLQPSIFTANGDSYAFAVRPGRSHLNRIVGAMLSLGSLSVVKPIVEATMNRTGAQRLPFAKHDAELRKVLLLLATSPLVTPPADDWPVPISVTGFMRLPPDPNWVPEPQLKAFLDDGPAPVFIGFGSMTQRDPQATSELVTRAVALSGVRAIVLNGQAGLNLGASESILPISGAPYGWLFPRVAAAVTHGGAGTTAAALAAGIAQVVIPHMGDQPFWGRRVHELGVGPAPIRRRALTAENLANAISEALNPSYNEAAKALGARIGAEDGARVAAEALIARWQRRA